MDIWMKRFENILSENGVEVFLLCKYVDDIFIISRSLQFNQKWDGSRIVKEGPNVSREGKTRAQHTLEVFRQIADSIFPFLKFTGDTPLDCPMP